MTGIYQVYYSLKTQMVIYLVYTRYIPGKSIPWGFQMSVTWQLTIELEH